MQQPIELVAALCRDTGLDSSGALPLLDLSETANCLRSSFAVGLAAQVSIGAAALSANEIYHARTGAYQPIRVRRRDAELESTGFFELDGQTPNPWDEFSGLYATSDGHVRVHANFPHHRDGALGLAGLSAQTASKEDFAAALLGWRADEYEQAAAAANLVVAKVRSFDEWDAHPHARANADAAPVTITKIGNALPRALTEQAADARPLCGLKILDLTRILAGPICGRTLAAYGADVLLINGPHLPNIPSIVDTSRGKRSAHVDLREETGKETLRDLLTEADVFVQGYRPGGLAQLGFGPERLLDEYPGLVYTSLTAYGPSGPWAERRGFDSLVQTATGFNHAEQEAFGAEAPKPMPMQILDYASGFLMAFGTQAALLRRACEGGSWHVAVSLLHTANWLRRMGRTPVSTEIAANLKDQLRAFPCAQGELRAMPHAAEFSRTPPEWVRPSVPVGTHQARWVQ